MGMKKILIRFIIGGAVVSTFAALEARSMIAGALAFFLYAAAVSWILMRYKPPALAEIWSGVHVAPWITTSPDWLDSLTNLGQYGVQCFYVISAITIAATLGHDAAAL